MSSHNAATLWEFLERPPTGSIALVSPETGLQLTYGELRKRVRSAAGALTSEGVRRGDRVAIASPNGIEVVIWFLAASIAGTAAPLNPAYRCEEFVFYLEDTNATVLVVPPDGAEEARRAADNRVRVLALDLAALPSHSHASDPQPDDIALILHTSGSTGCPKRVPVAHRNLSVSARNIAEHYALTPEDVSLCVMPLFHVHGLVASVLATLHSGGRVIVPAKFNALSFWRTVREHGVTWYSAVPTIHQVLLARAGSERPDGAESLRFIRSCSSALPPDQMSRMEGVFGVPVVEAYGMTEASHQMASNPLPPLARKPGSVGRATGIEIAIMNDSGELLAVETAGEVVIRGPSVVSGYEKNPEANAASFTNGWFHTGDQGVLDQDRYLRLTGRLKEMINRGGEKISPRELDEVLLRHPAVAEAVCYGFAHPTWGEEVAAAVVLKPEVRASEADLIAFCKEHVADFKRPKKIHIVPSVPKTASGKIQRRAVAAELAHL